MATALFDTVTIKRPSWRRKYKSPADVAFPKFTHGLEGQFTKLLGQPIALAQRIKSIRTHFDHVDSINQGLETRHMYITQKDFRWVDNDTDIQTYPGIFFTRTIHQRNYQFQVDLIEDQEGKLRAFNFSLSVS